MKLDSVLLLASYTPRSQVYAQFLTRASLLPEHVIIFGTKGGELPGQRDKVDSVRININLFLPDFSEPLEKTIAKWRVDVHKIDAQDVNGPEIYESINRLKPKLIIYCGYGAQLISKKLLHMGIPFLHVHSGWLPDYKGSTTLYYSWLKENFCAVSAIILSEGIDTGSVVARKKYAVPPEGIDPDYIYDNVIRADLLVLVLKKYAGDKRFVNMVPQAGGGSVYYVIHPVLKHLARLRPCSL